MNPTNTPPADKEEFNPRKWSNKNKSTLIYFAVLGGIVVLYGIIKYLVIPKCRQ